MSAENRLQELGITLPSPPNPGGNYVSAKIVGNLVFLSGVISTNEDGVITGQVDRNRSVDEGYQAARRCALTQLAVLRQMLGSLDRIRQIISVNGYVNAVAEFADSAKVINGASDLLIDVFGEAGKHVRAAVGVATLPRNALTEVQMSVEIHTA